VRIKQGFSDVLEAENAKFISLLEKSSGMLHLHELTYLLKTDDAGHFTGRVLEVPAVIVQGTSETEVHQKIEKATFNYLTTFEDEHKALMDGSRKSKLTDSGKGTILGTKPFRVYC
jgi:predicted RNase H-like HicB family nuclease